MAASAPTRTAVRLEFQRTPPAWRYMLGAFRPSPGLSQGGDFPAISARWSGWRADSGAVRDFLRLCGWPPEAQRQLPALLPHAIAFRLQMVVLTHPTFPVPIWRVLQVRNALLQLGPIGLDEALDFECSVHAHRLLDKGLEVDLHTRITAGGRLACESLNTFYVRGRFGAGGAAAAAAASPRVAGEPVASGHLPGGGGRRFGELTGDYNGIHLWDPYARAFGFRRAFFHPLRALGQGLARMPAGLPPAPYRLDAWFKGPVYQDSDVQLRTQSDEDGTVLALHLAQEDRPAIVARWRAVSEDSRLAAG
ncbi:MaoC family dehydratase [Ramlibacter sp.]|uniref:MaoC family dehydratase n=1 Tax=Ramlibacter sp. TaxID=1917967 RepID=UPI002D3C5DF3|nr:MaoC family dehydratase [Ramlibacter sp.]HYD76143.1 MaoC family dehydratase [Ramlibacter sp.]